MTWLELIGKVLVIGLTSAAVIAVVVVLFVIIWVYYEHFMGRNPFQ